MGVPQTNEKHSSTVTRSLASCGSRCRILQTQVYFWQVEHVYSSHVLYALAFLRGDQPDRALKALQYVCAGCFRIRYKSKLPTPDIRTRRRHCSTRTNIICTWTERGRAKIGFEINPLAPRDLAWRTQSSSLQECWAAEGEHVVAAKMYGEIIDMSRDKTEMGGHLARPLWFLASMEERLENHAKGERLRKEAKDERAKIHERDAPDEDTNEAFMSLVGWMLW